MDVAGTYKRGEFLKRKSDMKVVGGPAGVHQTSCKELIGVKVGGGGEPGLS